MKLVVTLVAALLIVEVAIKNFAPKLSIDLATFLTFPDVADSIDQANQNGIGSTLFLGSSLVRTNVDLPTIREHVSDDNQQFFKCMADATALSDWYYMFKRFYVHPNQKPNVLALCMSKDTLEDGYGFEPRRLSRHFCSTSDLRELIFHDLKDFDSRFSAVAAKVSSLFANRERLQLRLLNAVVPHYAETAQTMNRAARRNSTHNATRPEPQYTLLQRLIDEADKAGTQVVIVAMGMPDHYELPDPLIQLLESKNVPLLDMRQVDGIDPDMFPDGVHMNEAAAKLLSADLARQLAEFFSRHTGRL